MTITPSRSFEKLKALGMHYKFMTGLECKMYYSACFSKICRIIIFHMNLNTYIFVHAKMNCVQKQVIWILLVEHLKYTFPKFWSMSFRLYKNCWSLTFRLLAKLFTVLLCRRKNHSGFSWNTTFLFMISFLHVWVNNSLGWSMCFHLI